MGIVHRGTSRRAERLKPGHYNHTVFGDLGLCHSIRIFSVIQVVFTDGPGAEGVGV